MYHYFVPPCLLALKHHQEDLIAIAIAGSAWMLAQINDLPPSIQTALENSILAALVLFFVWSSWKREALLITRITKMEEQTPILLERTLVAMDGHSDAVKGLSTAINGMQRVLEKVTVQEDQRVEREGTIKQAVQEELHRRETNDNP